MSRGKAITLAVFTAWPPVYMVLFMVTIVGTVIFSISGGDGPSDPPTIMMILFPLHFLTMLLMFVLLAIYIIDVFKNDRVAQDKKALWAVVLFLGNMIAMPIYWYLYIWKEPEPGVPVPGPVGTGGAATDAPGAAPPPPLPEPGEPRG